MTKKLKARILSLALSVAMVFTMLPATVFAAEGDVPLSASSLECHVEHDEDCGYVEAVEGVACSHLNEDGTYSCAPVPDSGDVSGNAASLGDAEKEYVCGHMEECGYIESVAAVPCQHSCDICQIKDSGAMMSNQVRAANEITISDVTVSGTVGKPLASGITATLTLSGADNFGFMQDGATIPVDEWFTGLPAGIKVRAKISIDDPLTAILTFSGTPTATSSDVMAITIPGDEDSWVIAPFGADYLVKSNSNAKFAIEPTKTPTSIAISTPPTKTTYTAGESFDKAGMVVTATYDNSSTGVVTDYTVTPSGALDAGTSSVTISYTENNATVTATQAITVNKADYSGAALTATVEELKTTSGAQTYDLSSLLSGKTGFVDVSFAVGSTTNTEGVLSGNATVSGSTLNYTLTGTGAKDATATVAVTVSSKNYNDVTATITIKLIDKTNVIITGLSAPANRKYSGTAIANSEFGTPIFTPTWTGTLEYTYYEMSSGEVKLPDAPKNAGSYKVKIAIPDSDAAYIGEKIINFMIDKAEITVKADDKSMITGGTLPAFTVSYTGFAGTENANNAALTTAAVATTTADGAIVGNFEITISTPAVLNNTVGTNYTIISQDRGTLTVSEQLHTVAGGGGGSSSGGGGSSGTTTPTTKPTESVIGSSNTNATVDDKGNATVNLTDKNITDAVKAAKDAASKKGVNAGEVTAVINVTAPANSNPNTVTVNLPMTVQQQIISNKIGSLAIVIDKPDISVGMNLATITEMNKQANADIQLSASRTDATKLSTEAKNAIGSRPAFDLKATYASGSKSITSFGTGTVSVAIPYTLQAGEIAGGLYAVYVDGNGKVHYITNSSYDAENKVLRFSTNHFSVYGISYKAPIAYTDIVSHWAKIDIEFVVNRGLMSGTSNTTFDPNAAITREMFVTALSRLSGVDISGGTSDTPDQFITRQEMAVIMSNYEKAMGHTIPETRAAITFADNGSIGSWAASAVRQMQMAGILSGKDGNKFDPTGTATRGEIAAMLHRYVELIIDRTTTEGFTTNDSGSSLYYQSGKAVTGAKTINSVAYDFNSYGEIIR